VPAEKRSILPKRILSTKLQLNLLHSLHQLRITLIIEKYVNKVVRFNLQMRGLTPPSLDGISF